MHHPTDRVAHTMAFVTPVVEHWLEREIYIDHVLIHTFCCFLLFFIGYFSFLFSLIFIPNVGGYLITIVLATLNYNCLFLLQTVAELKLILVKLPLQLIYYFLICICSFVLKKIILLKMLYCLVLLNSVLF